MDRTDVKKKQERAVIAPLAKLLQLDVEDFIPDESPDFWFVYQGKRIGLEVVSCRPSAVHDGGRCNIQRIEDYIHNATTKYEQILRERKEQFAMATVTFYDDVFFMPDLRKKEFVDAVIEEMDRHLINDPFLERYYREITDEAYQAEYNRKASAGEFDYKFVEELDIYGDCIDGGPYVSYLNIAFSHTIEETFVNYFITKKEQKRQEYLTNEKNKVIVEYWLVIDVPVDERRYFDNYCPQSIANNGYSRIYLTQYNDIKQIKGDAEQ